MTNIFRLRRIDERFLRHSEWTRRLGIPSFTAIACVLSFPLLFFVLMPASLITVAGPSTLIALLVAFLLVFLTGSHLVELACAMPKNCVNYHFTFAVVGEFPAFIVAWLSLLDALCISSLLMSSWSSHLNFLFRKGIHPVMSMEITEESWILSENYDLLAALGVLFSLLILCCSLKVVGTISICLLMVTVLVVASCTMVAFFHADPQNWIDANFFSFGFNGVLRGCCTMMVAFCGIEAMTSLLEESHNPRGRLPTLLPTLNLGLGTAFFVVVMIFSLCVNVKMLNPENVVPEFFSLLNIPAARYLLSVASVCGLSGAALASFLPGSRIIASLSQDNLLPLPKDKSKNSPFLAMTFLSILLCGSFIIRKDQILDIVCLTTPCKLIIVICLIFLQHYLPEPVGILQETSSYKKFSKKRYQISASNSMASEMRHSQCSVDTAVFVQMNIASIESDRLQQKLEQKQKEDYDESMPVLSDNLPNYSSTRYYSGLEAINHGHNCLTETCAPMHENGELDDNRVHLFHREVPEIPYCDSMHESRKSITIVDSELEFRRAQGCLALFLISFSLASIVFVGVDEHTTSSYLLVILFLIISLMAIALTHNLVRNDHVQREESLYYCRTDIFLRIKAKVPLFPYISFLALSGIIFVTASTPLTTWYLTTGWMSIGFALYFSYGFWFSVERHGPTRKLTSEDSEAYTAIIGDDIISEMM